MTDKPSAPPEAPAEGDRIVIRDKRKINPSSTGTESAPAAAQEAAPAEAPVAESTETAEAPSQSAEIGELKSALDERTADLQRIAAEYANYRKRVGRDRTFAAEEAISKVLEALLPVLDDVDRARDHGDLNGPFASVAEQLTTVVSKFGLTAFGVKGDAFDPKLHDAVAHMTSADVTAPTCVDVMRRGYLMGERLLRPAMVAVGEPAPEPAPEPAKQEEPAEAAAEAEAEPAPNPEYKPESE